jgi:hypothetical protein
MAAAEQMAPWFEDLGYALPRYRVAIGFPSTGKRGKRIGECWDGKASADGTFEVLISGHDLAPDWRCGADHLNPPVEKSKAIRGTRDEFRDAMRQLAKDHVLALLTAHPDTWELADVPAGCAAVRPFRPDGRGRAGGGN